MVLIAGCRSSEWQTEGIDRPTSTTAKVYTDDEAGIAESLTDHLSAVGSNLNEWAAPREEAACAARKIVQVMGVDRLLDLGYDPQKGRLRLQYSDEERTAVTNILAGCIDVAEGLLSLFSAYGKLGVTPAACLTRGIERQGLDRDFIVGVLTAKPPDPFAQDNQFGIAMSRLMIECLDGGADLLPIAPLSPFPQDVDLTTTTSGAGGGVAQTTTTAP
ncbi:MAG: hypothetical protein IT195_05735 [Microthrixaceae bacterium]|nr:hypothetical protein [Microthrixaceae bacterium]